MIKAVIFDFFGVLALRGTTSFRQSYFPDDQNKIRQADGLKDKLNRGDISYDGYVDGLAKVAGVNRESVLEHTENYHDNSKLISYITENLKPKYKIGIISNAGEDWVLKILGKSNLALFDDIILSYKVDFVKPEPQIYDMSAKNLDVEPQQCVFVDDILKYCQGAEAVGMKSIWYKDFPQMKTELEIILTSSDD